MQKTAGAHSRERNEQESKQTKNRQNKRDIMPSIRDQSTVEAIAREFCSNGRDKGSSLRDVGYSRNYSEHSGLKLFDNVRLIEAIASIDAISATKAGRTTEQLDAMYTKAYALASKCSQPSAMNGSVTGIARLYGMDKDAGAANLDKPAQLTPEERDSLKAMAARLTNKPRLVKVKDVS